MLIVFSLELFWETVVETSAYIEIGCVYFLEVIHPTQKRYLFGLLQKPAELKANRAGRM